MATIIDGKQVARELLQEVKQDTATLLEQEGITPDLAVVLVGEDPASQVYVRNKIRTTGEVGIRSFEYRLPAETSQRELNQLIDTLNAKAEVHGILVQLPLPEGLDEADIIARIDPNKDVDGFHPLNVGALASTGANLVPCTPLGCLQMLKRQLGDLSGLNAVVVGRSNIVGKPMAALLLKEHCSVTVIHSRTRNPAAIARHADILVVAVGSPAMVKADWVKPGATVIDVGINALHGGEGKKRRLVGDVDFAEVEPVAGAITPVPGGVGPMTIACLMLNTLKAARAHSATTANEPVATPT